MSTRTNPAFQIPVLVAAHIGLVSGRLVLLVWPGWVAMVTASGVTAGITTSYAARLDRLSRLRVQEVKGGERILLGHAYLAPDDKHLLVECYGADLVYKLSDAEPVNRH
jgi:two-component system chemotaxis response regulator CheB